MPQLRGRPDEKRLGTRPWCLALVALILPAPPAAARVSGDREVAHGGGAQDEQGNGGLDVSEIVVTAQRRSERLRDVPLSIAVATEEDLQRQGINGLEDLVSRIAGLHISRDSSQTTFSVRGIQSSASSDTTSATAGLYLDEYPLYDTWFRYSSPDLPVYDIQRVEVLRGPQGTLYGATALSGSIRFITNKPVLDSYEAKFAGTVTDTSGGAAGYDLDAVLNIPVNNGKVAVRAVGYVRRDGGYIDNPMQGRTDTNGQRTYGGRLYLRSQPNETLNLLTSFVYQRNIQDDQSASLFFAPADGSRTEWQGALPARTKSDLLISSLNAEQELDGGRLNLTATYARNWHHDRYDATPYVFLFGGGMTPTVESRPGDSITKIIELRYASKATDNLRFVLGAYYNSRFRQFYQSASAASLEAARGTSFAYDSYGNQRSTEFAAFGEGTFSLSSKLEATLGLRVFRNAYHFYGRTRGLIIDSADPNSFQVTDTSNNQSSYIPRFSLLYRLTENANVYATASKGYRFGLTNYNSSSKGDVPLPYKSDTLWNYELGVKAALWNGRMTLNSDVYYVVWSDVQLPFRNASNLTYITNAGDARSYGIETEWAFRLSHALQLNAAWSVGPAEITRGSPNVVRRTASARGPTVYGLQKGDRLPGSQIVNGSVGVQYTRGLGRGEAYLRLDDVFVGSFYSDFMREGSLRGGGYNLVNVHVGYRLSRIEVTAFAENLFGSHGIVSAVPNADLLGTDVAFRVRPRTIGIKIRSTMGFDS